MFRNLKKLSILITFAIFFNFIVLNDRSLSKSMVKITPPNAKESIKPDSLKKSKRPEIKWKKKIGIQSWRNNPVVVGKYLYVGSSGEKWNKPDKMDGLYCFDIETGKQIWFVHSKADFNDVTYIDGLIIGGSDSGELFAVSPISGKVKWRRNLGAKIYAKPWYAGNLVVGTAKGYLYLINLKDGKIFGKVELKGAIRNGISSRENELWVCTEDGYIYKFFVFAGISLQWNGIVYAPDQYGKNVDLEKLLPGTLDFSHLNPPGFSPGSFYSAPIIVDNKVIFGFVRETYYSYPAFVAINSKDHKVLWFGSGDLGDREVFGNVRFTPGLYKKELIICGNPYSNKIYALSIKDGTLKWEMSVGQPMFQHWSSPIVKGEYVYVARHDGYLHKLEAKTGKRIWSMFLGTNDAAGLTFLTDEKVPGEDYASDLEPTNSSAIYSTPAVYGDNIVVGTDEGYIYVIKE